jgi:hypothetical protein
MQRTVDRDSQESWPEPTNRTPTWQYVAGVLLTIVLIIAGSSLSETRDDIKALQTAKLDKESYYNNQREMNKKIDSMDGKLTCIYEMLIEEGRGSGRSAERARGGLRTPR